MKVYQVYHNHVVLHTCDTREYAMFLRDWEAAAWEQSYRAASWPYLQMLGQLRKKCNDQIFVMEVEVVSEPK